MYRSKSSSMSSVMLPVLPTSGFVAFVGFASCSEEVGYAVPLHYIQVFTFHFALLVVVELLYGLSSRSTQPLRKELRHMILPSHVVRQTAKCLRLVVPVQSLHAAGCISAFASSFYELVFSAREASPVCRRPVKLDSDSRGILCVRNFAPAGFSGCSTSAGKTVTYRRCDPRLPAHKIFTTPSVTLTSSSLALRISGPAVNCFPCSTSFSSVCC